MQHATEKVLLSFHSGKKGASSVSHEHVFVGMVKCLCIS